MMDFGTFCIYVRLPIQPRTCSITCNGLKSVTIDPPISPNVLFGHDSRLLLVADGLTQKKNQDFRLWWILNPILREVTTRLMWDKFPTQLIWDKSHNLQST